MWEDSICGQSGDLTSSDESFHLQVKIQCTQANNKILTPHHLITNQAYRWKPHHKRNQYLSARLDTCADVNIMPTSVYTLVFQDPNCKKLAPSKEAWNWHIYYQYSKVGWILYVHLVHPDTKCLQEVTFYMASNNGSVLLSCATMLALGLIQPHTRLDYLPHRASLITSSDDHPKKTKFQISVHVSRKESEVSTVSSHKAMVPKLITSKEQILICSDVFNGIGCFSGPPYHIQVNPGVTSKQTHCWQVPVHLKEAFKKEVDKMLQVEVLKPDNQATPWINSYLLGEGKYMLGNLKLRICLDPTNLSRAIVPKPYHFKTPEDIAHLLAEAWMITVCDCRKGYWHQQLDEAYSFLTTFNSELGRFWCTVMLFGATVTGDVFQHKLDECFGRSNK